VWDAHFYDRVDVAGTVYQTAGSEEKRRRTRSVIPAKSVDEHDNEVITYGLVQKILNISPFPMLHTQLNGTYVYCDWYVIQEHIGDSNIPVVELGPERGMWPVHMIVPINVMVVQLSSDSRHPTRERFALIDLQRQFV